MSMLPLALGSKLKALLWLLLSHQCALSALLCCGCVRNLRACRCTSARLFGRLMDVTCPHAPRESHPTGQWRSRSMNQWTDIAEADRVLAAGPKDGREPQNTHAHTVHQTCGPKGASESSSRGLPCKLTPFLSRQIQMTACLPDLLPYSALIFRAWGHSVTASSFTWTAATQ